DRFASVDAFKAALLGGASAAPRAALQPAPPPTILPVQNLDRADPGQPAALQPAPPAQVPVPARRFSWPRVIGLGCLGLLAAVGALAGGAGLGYMLIKPTPAPSQTPGATATSTFPALTDTPGLSATPTTTLRPAIVPSST